MKQNKIKPTNSELEVLQVIWENGPSTVKSINDKLNENKEVGYTTTLKIMQIMYNKGILNREKDSRTHIYSARISQEETQLDLLDRFLEKAFNGSASKLVMQALGNHETSKEELENIKAFINQIETNQND